MQRLRLVGGVNRGHRPERGTGKGTGLEGGGSYVKVGNPNLRGLGGRVFCAGGGCEAQPRMVRAEAIYRPFGAFAQAEVGGSGSDFS